MKKLSILRFLVCILTLSVVLSSCRKENTETIEEIVEEASPLFLVALNGNTTEYDSYAAYCNENGIESFSVSNNIDLLDDNLWEGSLTEGDFIVHYRKDASSEFKISGAAFETTFNGEPVIIVSSDASGNIVIDEANSTQVVGSMDGIFLVNPLTAEIVSYSVEFAAEVDPDRIPVYCQ